MSLSLLSFLRRRSSAPVARQRLQILLAHERTVIGQTDLIAILREEILAGIAKHVRMDPDKVQVKMERGDVVSTLEVEVEIPLNVRSQPSFEVSDQSVRHGCL